MRVVYWAGIVPLVAVVVLVHLMFSTWAWLFPERQEECMDCGSVFGPFRWKSDHHGGKKFVCLDRDRCNKRTTGYA